MDLKYFNLNNQKAQLESDLSTVKRAYLAKPLQIEGDEMIYWTGEMLNIMSGLKEPEANILKRKIYKLGFKNHKNLLDFIY